METATAETLAGTEAAPVHPLPVQRTIWGMDALQLHTRYWAAHGVQVVRQGEPSQIVRHAEIYLLTDPRTLALFSLHQLLETLNWIKPQLLIVRLHDDRERGYRERAVTDADGKFIRFQRLYDASEDSKLARVAFTTDREIAQLWQNSPDALSGWRRLRRFIRSNERVTRSIAGRVYDRSLDADVRSYLMDVMRQWNRPDTTVARAQQFHEQVWADASATIDENAKFIGPVWIGAGRQVDGGTTVIGPAVLWDDPQARPATEAIQWLMIEPKSPPPDASPKPITSIDRAFKRLFDVVFATAAVALTLPLYPFIMLAIWIEDGRPFFFAHMRETMGGREFPCVKFRSMRKDAEKVKAELAARNQADGPQFWMEDDPRLTRVGKFLRKYHLDELPQFLNVLIGHMSIVGPRPSPRKENQFCPEWREARLSVRPGITGLWQVKRTRAAGSDFQEWIKYDIEYVENLNWRLDLFIIWKTITQIFQRMTRS